MSSPDPIPTELRRFILTSIGSVPHLEGLLLLSRDPDQGWDAAALARRLYVTETVARGVLVDLQHAGLIHRDSGTEIYRFGQVAPELAALVSDLEAVYARNLVEVTLLIHSRLDRSAQHFADAFQWRRKS